ncbi:MAG: patatin-like phospholipase family protein [Ardenticatenaceae bacterium]|nr:patatin-like phospholipase family protein [Anaerolineales bacterium]MCB8940649.1 patatin-like phospholipase family protein [Ardenticatenaceae bacterium]MCB8971979.1 patatin-like phospholipase family protein [Ardenticatenaceae bacterium]
MLTSNPKRALVLSGGGGRGAYHVGVLRFLEEHEWYPDVVVGTSIGAVNGAALASGHNAHSLWALWRKLRTKDVQKPNWNPFSSVSLLDTSPLRNTLLNEGWVDFERINDPEKTAVHLRITATEISTGLLQIFSNSLNNKTEITVEHILSSCSIPLIYPHTSLGETKYWDGAVVANTPLSAAIATGAEEIFVVIMTPIKQSGEASIPTLPSTMPTNLYEAASMTLEWALLASFQADMKMFSLINSLAEIRDELDKIQADYPNIVDQYMQDVNNFVGANVKKDYKKLKKPIIICPEDFIPVEQIVSYTEEWHEKLHKLGYDDAKLAWKKEGYVVE